MVDGGDDHETVTLESGLERSRRRAEILVGNFVDATAILSFTRWHRRTHSKSIVLASASRFALPKLRRTTR